MAISTQQYLNMRGALRGALSGNYPGQANPSNAEVLGFMAQLLADSIGASALSARQQTALDSAMLGTLSSNLAAFNPTAAQVVEFWQQVATDSAGAATLAPERYKAIRSVFLDAVSNNYPGTVNPTIADLFRYFSPYAFSVTALPGLALWMDGRAAAFSDAGVTPSVAPFGRVQRINQPAPLASFWNVSFGAALRPFRETNALDLQYGPPSQINQPAAIVPADNSSWGFNFRHGLSTTTLNIVFMGFDSVGNFGVSVANGQLRVFYKGLIWDTTIPVPPGSRGSGVLTCALNYAIKATVNGTTYDLSLAATPPAANITAVCLGAGAALSSQAAIGQLLATSALSAADRDGLLGFLIANEPGDYPVNAPLISVAGDSIGAGAGATIATSVMYKTQVDLYGNATPPRLFNPSVAGYTIANCDTEFSTIIAPRYSALRAKNILVVQVLTNSMPCTLANAATNAAAVLAAYSAYCLRARAFGFLVVACTCLPRADAGKGTGFDSCWNIVNTDIRANFATYANALADFAGAVGMSTIADAAAGAPNFQPDLIHVATPGYAIMSGVLTPTIATLLAA